MNLFDKICAVPAFVLAVLLVVLGIPGLFCGCSANFHLPPILGILPALVGWAIIRSILIAWRAGRGSPLPIQRPPFNEEQPL